MGHPVPISAFTGEREREICRNGFFSRKIKREREGSRDIERDKLPMYKPCLPISVFTGEREREIYRHEFFSRKRKREREGSRDKERDKLPIYKPC